MDWRSLTQVKELGMFIRDCECLANDISKIFEVLWILGKENKIPSIWANNLHTKINITNPIVIMNDNTQTESLVYISVSYFFSKF